ncbi:MAG: hypothetical protein QOJ91_3135 [Sphingomonadales bacterium]|nr:hypothetical protein [Sphingomonadales bacterium]
MADLGAANAVGEAIVGLLMQRRSLLAAEGLLGPLPADAAIRQLPVAALVGPTPPSAGLSVTCWHVRRLDRRSPRPVMAEPREGSLDLELSYLLASWGPSSAEELSMLSWAMLELNRFPVLDPVLLPAGESVQLVPDNPDPERLLRLWSALGLKYRLSTLFTARAVRIGERPTVDDKG